MSDLFIINGAISSKVAELTLSIINQLNNPAKYKMSDLVSALENDPVSYACAQLKSARISQLIGKYHNKNKEHEKFVNYNLANMDETLQTVGGRHGSACPLGYALSEVIFKTERYKGRKVWVLKGFNFLNPANCHFRVKKGQPIDIKYRDGHRDVYIPYWKVLHVVNSLNTSFSARSLYGSPEMSRAYPYIKLKQMIFGQLAVAAKNRAGGILVGKADSSQKVIDEKDPNQVKTISALQALARQLAQVENNNIIVTDKQNELSSMQLPAGEQFWNFAKDLVDEQIMRSFQIPQMIWSEGSGALGVGSLSNTQLSILDSSLLMVVQLIRDQLVEKVIRPLIYFNFGKQDDYGEFEFKPDTDPANEAMLTQSLMSALSSGLIQQTDYQAVNKLRERLKLDPIDPEVQMEQMSIQQRMQAMLAKEGQEQAASLGMSPEGTIPAEE